MNGKATAPTRGRTGTATSGDFVKGKQTGHGVFIGPDFRYEGEFLDGLRHGRGVETWASGERVDGTWVRDVEEGPGILFFAPSGYRCECTWTHGEITGRGIRKWKSGERYEGNLVKHQMEGKGVLWMLKGERCEGQFASDKQNGHGVLIKADGSRWEGEFLNGKPVMPAADNSLIRCRRCVVG